MIYTYHYLSAMTGEPAPFFSIKQLVFFSFIRDPSPLKTQRKSKRGSTWRLLSKHKMPAKCWRGFLPTKIDHEFSWPHEPQNSFPTKVHLDFNMSKKVSATCPYKSQLMLSSSLYNGLSTKVRGLRYIFLTKSSSHSILYRPQGKHVCSGNWHGDKYIRFLWIFPQPWELRLQFDDSPNLNHDLGDLWQSMVTFLRLFRVTSSAPRCSRKPSGRYPPEVQMGDMRDMTGARASDIDQWIDFMGTNWDIYIYNVYIYSIYLIVV